MVVVQPRDLPSLLQAARLGAAVDRRRPLVVDLSAGRLPSGAGIDADLRAYPAVTIGISVGAAADDTPPFDVLLTDQPELAARGRWVLADVDSDLDAIRSTVSGAPIAARILVGVLRFAQRRDADEGLLAESTAYSTLQAGPEFGVWLASRSVPPSRPDTGDVIVAARVDDTLTVELNRPQVRNAFNARMRERLVDLLTTAAADPALRRITISGRGADFCTGGDLTEFGTAADPAQAHLLRLDRSPARLLAALAPRVEAHLHGACIGAGVELPAFAGRVVAAPRTSFRLPEVGMGLIPGAGGTVSLPRRIGWQRTAYLALVGRSIDTQTAHAWGLVDEVAGRVRPGATITDTSVM